LYNSDIKNVCDLLFVYQHNFIHRYVVLLSGTEIARSGAQGYSDNCETGCFVFRWLYYFPFKLSRVKNLCCFLDLLFLYSLDQTQPSRLHLCEQLQLHSKV